VFTDDSRRAAQEQIQQQGVKSFAHLVTPDILGEAAGRVGLTLRKIPLHLGNLAWLGIACAIHGTKSFADVLVLTLKILSDSEGFGATPLGRIEAGDRRRASKSKKSKSGKKRSKHNPHGSRRTAVTEEAFVQARQKMPWGFWIALVCVLADRFAARYRSHLCWRGFRLLALDGTVINLPCEKALAEHFGTPKNQRSKKGKKGTPQARMAMMQFPLTRVPFRFEVSPLKTGERTLARSMMSSLEADDLLLVDRGFWSFGLFCDVQRRAAFFGIRLVAKVKLTTVRRLGPKDRIVRYQPAARGRWAKEGYPPSIELRVIDYQIPGFRKSAIVTNVLDPKVLSREDWVRLTTQSEAGRNLAPGLYHRRWEIETTFRELKVSQGMQKSLRGRTPQTILYEIAGHVVLYLLTRWLMMEAAIAHGEDPLRLSFTQARRELEDMQALLIVSSPHHVSHVLLPRLLKRIASHRIPHRPGRHYSRPGDTRTKRKGPGRIARPAKLKSKPSKTIRKKAA
jgi:hypothetical protein